MPTSTRVDRTIERLEWPDLLRGLAAFAIVLFHVRVTLWIGLRVLMVDEGASAFNRLTAWFTAPFQFFGTAVMLFFVVSGFVIHYPYAAGGASFSLQSYATRRLLRIYPPYLIAVLLTVVAERLAGALDGFAPSTWGKVAATAFMLQNYHPPAGQLAGNPSLWSLPVEVELYAVYPLLLWFWRRAGILPMLAIVSTCSTLAAVLTLRGYTWPMGNFAKYWIVWVAGAVLAEWFKSDSLPKWNRGYSALATVILASGMSTRIAGTPIGIEHFVWGGLYFLLLLWALNRPHVPSLIPDGTKAALSFLGRVSYSLYLIHFPLFVVLGAGWIAWFGQKPVSVGIPLLASFTSIPLAYGLWRYVERPSQALGRALTNRQAPIVRQPVVAAG